jgi:hypothetical protein
MPEGSRSHREEARRRTDYSPRSRLIRDALYRIRAWTHLIALEGGATHGFVPTDMKEWTLAHVRWRPIFLTTTGAADTVAANRVPRDLAGGIHRMGCPTVVVSREHRQSEHPSPYYGMRKAKCTDILSESVMNKRNLPQPFVTFSRTCDVISIRNFPRRGCCAGCDLTLDLSRTGRPAQGWILAGALSGLLRRIATESVSLCVRMKS